MGGIYSDIFGPVGQELAARLAATRLGGVSSALQGKTDEQIAAEQKAAQETADILSKARAASPGGRAASYLFSGKPAAAPAAKPEPFVPPVSQPAETKAAVATTAKTEPRPERVLRQVDNPATGGKMWTYVDVAPGGGPEGWKGYEQALGQSEAARQRTTNIAAEAGRNMATGSLSSGEMSPRGFATRQGPGAYSYTGTQDFALNTPEDIAREKGRIETLHPLEARAVRERLAEGNAIRMQDLQTREAEAGVKQREAAAEEAMDPVGFRQKQTAAYHQAALQELGNPKSLLFMTYRRAVLDFQAKYPDAKPEDIAQYAALKQAELLKGYADEQAARYGSLIQQYDPRVLAAQARSGFGFPTGMPPAGGSTP